MDQKEMEIRFTYHSPRGDQLERAKSIRALAKKLAEYIVEQTHESREQSLAITHLEQAVMWANAGIARREWERN